MTTHSDDGAEALWVVRLHHTHPDGASALEITDLCIPLGALTVICGRNGAGKSLLGLALCGLLPHAKLTVERHENGRRVGGVLTTTQLQRQSGIIFQNSEHQVVGQTVEDDISFGLRNLRLPFVEVRGRTAEIMALCEIEHLAARHPLSLSGGELKRVAIAGMVALRPRLLLLDEPFLSVDWHAQQQLLELLLTLQRQGTTPVIITHNLYGAQHYAEWMLVMSSGRLRAAGAPRQVLPVAVEERVVGEDALALEWR